MWSLTTINLYCDTLNSDLLESILYCTSSIEGQLTHSFKARQIKDNIKTVITEHGIEVAEHKVQYLVRPMDGRVINISRRKK